MNRVDRKAAKLSIRDALRARARGLPLSPEAEVVFAQIEQLRQTEGAVATKRLLSWAVGVSLTIIAFHERIGTKTIQTRIDRTLDSLRERQQGRP